MQADCNLYGIDSFVFNVVEVISDISLIKQREQEYIAIARENGMQLYNVKHGGDGLGIDVSSATRDKIRRHNVGRIVSQETRDKIASKLCGENSNLAILTTADVVVIKRRIMNHDDIHQIATDYNVKDMCIKNIYLNLRWTNVVVDGWDDFQLARPKRHKLSISEELEIVELLKLKAIKHHIHKQYKVSYDKINSLIKQYNLEDY